MLLKTRSPGKYDDVDDRAAAANHTERWKRQRSNLLKRGGKKADSTFRQRVLNLDIG
jgi:hypothetical protein